MARKKNRSGRPKLTVITGNGSRKSVQGSRFPADSSVKGLPTRIYFSRGSSTPTGRSLVTLRSYADWLATRRSRAILILGHANRGTWPEAARALALARARAVRDLLVFLGAKPDQVRRVSAAKLHRVDERSTSSERRRHRYVELIPVPSGRVPAELPMPPRMREGWRASRRSA